MGNYLNIGQVGVIDDIKVQCVSILDDDYEKWIATESGCCEYFGCAFNNKIVCVNAKCCADERNDHENVYYKKVE